LSRSNSAKVDPIPSEALEGAGGAGWDQIG